MELIKRITIILSFLRHYRYNYRLRLHLLFKCLPLLTIFFTVSIIVTVPLTVIIVNIAFFSTFVTIFIIVFASIFATVFGSKKNRNGEKPYKFKKMKPLHRTKKVNAKKLKRKVTDKTSLYPFLKLFPTVLLNFFE